MGFFDDFIAANNFSQGEVVAISNRKRQPLQRVEFTRKEDIEFLAGSVLANIAYTEGEVALDDICSNELSRNGLMIIKDDTEYMVGTTAKRLGSIRFQPLEIRLYTQLLSHPGRARFTLAHELGHHFLGHSKYMRAEYCQESDFRFDVPPNVEATDIARMEWQANYFASCLLLPKYNFTRSFFAQLNELDIHDKGFAPLYTDNQRENLYNFRIITNNLSIEYFVSKAVVKIRLEGLGLLNDQRNKSKFKNVVEFDKFAGSTTDNDLD